MSPGTNASRHFSPGSRWTTTNDRAGGHRTYRYFCQYLQQIRGCPSS